LTGLFEELRNKMEDAPVSDRKEESDNIRD